MWGYGPNSQAGATIAENWRQNKRTHRLAGRAVSLGGHSAHNGETPRKALNYMLTERVSGGSGREILLKKEKYYWKKINAIASPLGFRYMSPENVLSVWKGDWKTRLGGLEPKENNKESQLCVFMRSLPGNIPIHSHSFQIS